MRGLRSNLTYANVVATIALFLVLGGGAYAGSRLAKNSVGTKQIQNAAVTRAKLSAGVLSELRGVPGPPGPKGDEGPPGVAGVSPALLVSGTPVVATPPNGVVFGSIFLSDVGAAQLTVVVEADQITAPGTGTMECSGTIHFTSTGLDRILAFPVVDLPADPSKEVEATSVQIYDGVDGTVDDFQQVFVSCDFSTGPTSVRVTPKVAVLRLG